MKDIINKFQTHRFEDTSLLFSLSDAFRRLALSLIVVILMVFGSNSALAGCVQVHLKNPNYPLSDCTSERLSTQRAVPQKAYDTQGTICKHECRKIGKCWSGAYMYVYDNETNKICYRNSNDEARCGCNKVKETDKCTSSTCKYGSPI